MILPEASLPIAEPSPEVVTYHARTSDLVDEVVSCEMVDLSDISRVQDKGSKSEQPYSSILRKGPKSPPVMLITPKMAANSRSQKFSNMAKTIPLEIINKEPPIKTFRRPTRSAMRVRYVPRKTSPRSVRVMKRPIWWSEKFNAEKNIAIWFC